MSFDLADVRSVKLIDEGARRDVGEFASASASARRRDAKTIVVTSDGSGSREMLVSYTIAAPIWKTTYRVVLDSQGMPFFQGWAIVDNVSEEDWNNISLSLISGSLASVGASPDGAVLSIDRGKEGTATVTLRSDAVIREREAAVASKLPLGPTVHG